ncbi:uncharacterized protein [Haliotis asinina]|uniref:uncharacterized protein n=1 Tax=Haliotis asinina TaxID=109174 RepID=UPI003531D5AE
MCTLPLVLNNCVEITSQGLGSTLKIICSACQASNLISTGKKQNRVFDMNKKLAAAMLHTGLGESDINNLLAALNIPTVSHFMLDQRQKETGAVMEIVAKESMKDFVKEKIIFRNCDIMTLCFPFFSSPGSRRISVSVDAGWQKRGSGKCYDSLSGHCSMIGNKTGKVLGYSIRSKSCRMCYEAFKANRTPTEHDCKKNWDGSSKGMEPDMVSEMVVKAKEEDVHVTSIIGGDDATSITRLRANIDKDIVKQSDKNHVRKGLGNKFYQLQKKHKTLSTKVIKYLQKCFNYMISQNRGNQDGISRGLTALSCHPFGDHSKCDDTWCRFLKSSSSNYKSLPYGKALSDLSLKADLKAMFDNYAIHKVRLASLGSTQANESFNKTVSSKAPKSRHYSGSSSLHFRVAASVAQKNVGHSYIMAYSWTGTYTRRHFTLKDLQHRKRKAIASTIKAKQRRLHLKAMRSQKRIVREVREGTTYYPMVDMSGDTDDLVDIPPPLPVPVQKHLELSNTTEIFFDLEATGLARTSHVTQIAAVRGEEQFNQYILPKVQITPVAAEVTGIHVEGTRMFHHGKEVYPVPLKTAVGNLISFLSKSEGNVLIGHNIKLYDCPLFFNALLASDYALQFSKHVHGFLDTLQLFKLSNPGLKSYSQAALFKNIVGSDYVAHDALTDALALQTLYSACHASLEAKILSTFCLKYCTDSLTRSKAIQANLPSLQHLVCEKVLSENMARKIASSGLCFDHLKVVYKRQGYVGLSNVLSEKYHNKCRVTSSQKIVQSLSHYFCKGTI